MNTNTGNYRTLPSMQPSHLTGTVILWNLKRGDRTLETKGTVREVVLWFFYMFTLRLFKIIINITIK